jgi:hypothetical protein
MSILNVKALSHPDVSANSVVINSDTSLTISSNVAISGATTSVAALTASGTASVTGATTFANTVSVVGTSTFSNTTVSGTATLTGITESRATKSTSFTPDLSTEGTVFSVSGTITITMPTAASGKFFTIIDSGSGTLSWSGTIYWASGSTPSPSGVTIYTFVSDGTNWYGSMAGTGFATV